MTLLKGEGTRYAKNKTHSGTKKRVKLTAGRKLKRRRAFSATS